MPYYLVSTADSSPGSDWLAVQGLEACVCSYGYVALFPRDIIPQPGAAGQRKGRQMAAFRSTTGQHMGRGDKVCVCV